MSAKTQYSVSDWLNLHQWTKEDVTEYCYAIKAAYQPNPESSRTDDTVKRRPFDLDHSLQNLVRPSLNTLLGFADAPGYDMSSVKIIKYSPSQLDLSFTEWCEKADGPVIHIIWSGSVADLICLAHEISHAVQMILSAHVFMVPVAREVCAFLGELALIRFATGESDALYHQLCTVWRRQNAQYLGSDVARLLDDLKVILSPYIYRHNYPLARVVAMSLFVSMNCGQLKGFFASGSAACGFLNIADVMKELPRHDVMLGGEKESTPVEGEIVFGEGRLRMAHNTIINGLER
jgi:hypothetical protein